MAQIICQNLSVGYDSKVILENLSFEVNKGDYLCIVGENGSGKTTLIKSILGLIPTISGKLETGDGLKSNEIGHSKLSFSATFLLLLGRLFSLAVRGAWDFVHSTLNPISF